MLKGLATTVVSACLAGGVGIGLFFVKHEVKEQEARLAELNREIQRNQEEIHVLKAEWSYLNDPARLRQLSEKYLGMKVMAPSQVASLSSLPRDDAPMVAKAEPAKPAAIVVAKAAESKPPQPKPDQPKAVAKAPKDDAYRPPARALAAAPAAQATAPGKPARTIVIQSPSLAQTQAPAGEVR